MPNNDPGATHGRAMARRTFRLRRALNRSRLGSTEHLAGNGAAGAGEVLESIDVFKAPGKSMSQDRLFPLNSAIDHCSRPVGKSGNSCLSRILCVCASGRLNPLTVNRVRPRQPGGFPGFPGNFPGVYMAGGSVSRHLGAPRMGELGGNGSERFVQELTSKKSRWLKVDQGKSR